MARYRRAEWRPVSRYAAGGSSGGPMTPKRVVLHTAVSNSSSLFNLFDTPGNAVAHFYVARDGTVEQYVDTGRKSSAVLEGNYDCITIETWDGAPADWTPGPAWTERQVKAIGRLLAWINKVHGIPLVRLESSAAGLTGVGWHRLGIDGNFPAGLLAGRVPGTEKWSSAFGKICPGDRRIRQTVEEVLPLANYIASVEKDDDMFSDEDRDKLDRILKRLNEAAKNERARDAKEAERQKARYEALVAKVDGLSLSAPQKKAVKEAVAEVLREGVGA